MSQDSNKSYGLYPEIELTDGSSIFYGEHRGAIGIKDAKTYFERWFEIVGGIRRYPDFPTIHIIKLIRTIYEFAYKMGQKKPVNTEKTYTARDMHNAYLAGVNHGQQLFIDGINDIISIGDARLNESKTEADKASQLALEEFADQAAKGIGPNPKLKNELEGVLKDIFGSHVIKPTNFV